MCGEAWGFEKVCEAAISRAEDMAETIKRSVDFYLC
jgi:hypothetical protein